MERKPIAFDSVNGTAVPVIFSDGSVHPDYQRQLDVDLQGEHKVLKRAKELYIVHGKENHLMPLGNLFQAKKWLEFKLKNADFIKPDYWRRRRITTVLKALKVTVPAWAQTHRRS